MHSTIKILSFVFFAFYLPACSTYVAGGRSLAKHPQVQAAKKVLIAQSPELASYTERTELYRVVYMKSSVRQCPMPTPSMAQHMIRNLPSGIVGSQTRYEPPTPLPLTRTERFLDSNLFIKYAPIKPVPEADLTIILVPAASTESPGYYNPGIGPYGAYIAGTSTEGGHFANIHSFGPPNLLSRVEALLFSCRDGSYLGKTSATVTLLGTDTSQAGRLSELGAGQLVRSIFGRR